MLNRRATAQFLDHAVLRPDATRAELESGCAIALRYQVKALCVPSSAVAFVASKLQGSGVVPCATIGFPHGNAHARGKIHEAEMAMKDGARELDAVVNIGWVLSGEWKAVEEEIAALARTCREGHALLKVIFENCYLKDDHKTRLCAICTAAGVDFVKTSTGFGTHGAAVEDVRLMREHCPPSIGIKASGGIRTLEQVELFLNAGATRIGTSSTEAILNAIPA